MAKYRNGRRSKRFATQIGKHTIPYWMHWRRGHRIPGRRRLLKAAAGAVDPFPRLTKAAMMPKRLYDWGRTIGKAYRGRGRAGRRRHQFSGVGGYIAAY